MKTPFRNAWYGVVLCVGLLAAGACSKGIDIDLRDSATGFTTADAALQAASGRTGSDEQFAP